MERAAEVARGRTSSILLLALLIFGTIVIKTLPFLSQDVKYKISFNTVYIWETILLMCAFVAMVMLIMLRKHDKHLKKVTGGNTSRMQYVTPCLMAIFGVSASISPFYESQQVSTCLDVTDKQLHMLQFITYLCVGMYVIFQSMFGFLCYNYKCQSFLTRVLTVVIISANASLFSCCIWNTTRALNAQKSQDPFNNNTTDAERHYYFKHTLVYSVCENGTEIIDRSKTTQGVHKHTYPLLLEYLLFGVTLLVPLWNIVIRRHTPPGNEHVNADISPPAVNADISPPPVNVDISPPPVNADISPPPVNVDNSPSAVNADILPPAEQTEPVLNQTESQPLLQTGVFYHYIFKEKIIHSLKHALRFVSKYSIIFSSIFAVTVLILHLFVEIGNANRSNTNTTHHKVSSYNKAYYNLETVYIYIISSVPFIGYFIARRKQSLTIWHNVIDTVLLFVGGVVLVFLIIFQTVDNIVVLSNHSPRHLSEDVMYFIKLLFYYAGTYFQIKLILKAMCLPTGSGRGQNYKLHIKGIIIFLGFCNVERWLADSFMPPTELRYAVDIKSDDTFGHVTWFVIEQLLFPFSMFYRIWSVLMCFKAYSMIQ